MAPPAARPTRPEPARRKNQGQHNPTVAAHRLEGHDRSMSDAASPLNELFQTHRQGLAGAVRSVLGGSVDVNEVLQDAFLKCWRNWQTGTRPNDPVAWIFVVVWNVAVDARRRRQRTPIHETLDEATTVTTNTLPSPSHALEQREHVAAAQAAVAGLSDPEQQVFLLRVGGELTFEAVAEALAIPVGTAKTRMRSALQKLRQTLGATARGEESKR
ncbi:MAG TPA: RNA polymerase sigma factor [Planctomycetota bacterium]|nr:RNA polymerase sigma factor [Planctomycetota bacterium]